VSGSAGTSSAVFHARDGGIDAFGRAIFMPLLIGATIMRTGREVIMRQTKTLTTLVSAMNLGSLSVTRHVSALRSSIADAALSCIFAAGASLAWAQDSAYDPANYAWQAGAIAHAQKMRAYFDADSGAQPTPPAIPKFEIDFDPSGLIATFQPGGPTVTSQNPFFASLGTNGRTCFTCHQPQTGWTVSAASVQARFYASFGADPIFRLVDGATCPTADVSRIEAKHRAYSLLLSKGLIRIGLPVPATAQFRIASVDDPYNCNTNPVTGLTSPTTGIVSVYRRPLPAANLGFLSAIMWDGREPNLSSQAADATLGHAQAAAPPSSAQQQQIVNFESGVFAAQLFDNRAGLLNADDGNGGPVALQNQLAGFFIGINDPLGLNPKGTPFTSTIFDLYQAWRSIVGMGDEAAYRRSVARGEDLFNNTRINITGVAGLNDALNQPNIPGFCGTCHDTPDVGNHSIKAPLNIDVANAGAGAPVGLDISGLPVFTLQCVAGPLAGKSFVVTDPGRALISGNCADIGKLKGPILRGLAARAPYFHNGSAATLLDVVNFYDQRFGIGFTEQDRRDLAAFLQTL
jgi:cytochrome c peroxidase